MAKAAHSVHLSFEVNETSNLAEWHLPRTHFLESWGDTSAFDGSVSITQPLIQPMLADDQKGWSPIEFVAAVCGSEPSDGYSIVRATEAIRSGTSGATFESHWRSIPTPASRKDRDRDHREFEGRCGSHRRVGGHAGRRAPLGDRGGPRTQFLPDPRLYDGRYASVGWLQELPDP